VEKVTVHYDAEGASLTVWFGAPQDEVSSEEVGDDTVVMKDAAGRVIGVEKLNVAPPAGGRGLTVEVMPVAADAAA
jgi:hypothetical protein